MKKLFTLIAAIFMAVGANAASLNLGAPANNVKDDAGNVWYDASTKTITFHEAWSYRPGWWFSAKDLSDYDEIVIEFEGDIDYTIQANIEYASASADAVTSFQNTDDKNKIVITLDAQGKSSVKQLYLQAGDNGAGKTATFKSCYAKNDAPEPTQVAIDITKVNGVVDNGDGTYTYTTTSAWGWDNIWYGGFDASDYDFMGVELAEASDVNFQICINYTETVTDGGNVWVSAGSTSGQVDLSATGKSSISQIAFQTSAAGTVKIKSVYWGKKTATAISNVETGNVSKTEYYNISGQKLNAPQKGINIIKMTLDNGTKTSKKVILR